MYYCKLAFVEVELKYCVKVDMGISLADLQI